MFGNLRSEYQIPEMPSVFSTGRRGVHVSGFAAYNDQETVRYGGRYQAYTEGYPKVIYRSPHARPNLIPIEITESYRIERRPFQLGGSLVAQGRSWFCGIGGGWSGTDSRNSNFGTFGGYSSRFGDFVPSVSVGLFANDLTMRAASWKQEFPDPTEEDAYVEDSADTREFILDIPLKIGLLFQGPSGISPYAAFSRHAMNFLPDESTHPERFRILHDEAGLGLRFEGLGFATLNLESGVAWIAVGDGYRSYHVTGKLSLQRWL
jgi:hypothetical protein